MRATVPARSLPVVHPVAITSAAAAHPLAQDTAPTRVPSGAAVIAEGPHAPAVPEAPAVWVAAVPTVVAAVVAVVVAVAAAVADAAKDQKPIDQESPIEKQNLTS